MSKEAGHMWRHLLVVGVIEIEEGAGHHRRFVSKDPNTAGSAGHIM